MEMLLLTAKSPNVQFPPRGPTWGFDCRAKKKRTSSYAHTDVAGGERVAVGLGCEGEDVDRCQMGTSGEEG